MTELRHRIAQKWRWALLGESTRKEVEAIADKLHLATVEIADLKKRLTESTVAQSKAQANAQRLWNFIALRNKPVDATSIKSLLDRLNAKKT